MKLSTASSLLAVALLAALSQTAFAGGAPPIHVPEPDVLALLAIGGVAMTAVKWRNRRK